jgi:hypothetical protein
MSYDTTFVQSNHEISYRDAQRRVVCYKDARTTLTRKLSNAVLENGLSSVWIKSAKAVVQEHGL